MASEELIKDIASFKRALNQPGDASDSDESIGDSYLNRGNKLKRNARLVHEGKLVSVPLDGYQVNVVDFAGEKRAIVYKKRKLDGDSDSEDEEEPYQDIDLQKIMKPVTTPSEVVTHQAISKIFKSQTIKTMYTRALELILEEQKKVVALSKLMTLLLGDDTRQYMADKLHLPDYLDSAASASGTSGAPATNSDGVASTGMATRRSTRSAPDIDPFFAMPELAPAEPLLSNPEILEETKQLTQIALQRSEEFVRCMTMVRFGLLKANRYKEQVYNWCAEIKEDEDNAEAEHDSDEEAEQEVEDDY